jgi:hypothetical protein
MPAVKLARALGVIAIAFTLVACKDKAAAGGTNGPTKMGEVVKLEDSEWTVIEARDAGKTMKSNSETNNEEKKTAGRFIEVHFKITNKGTKEEMVLPPKIVDDKNREFEAIDSESDYVPAKAQTLGFATLVPNTPREFWTVIEVPADAKSLKLQVHGFTTRDEKKNIDLGL